jgi:hypothetical protein
MHGAAVRCHEDFCSPVNRSEGIETRFAVEPSTPACHQAAYLIQSRLIVEASRKDDAKTFPLETIGQRSERSRLP